MVAEALVESTPTPRAVWGIPVLATDLPRAAEIVVTKALSGGGGYACFCNVHVLVTAQHDERLRRALEGAAVVFADGWPVAHLQRGAGASTAERIPGADLMAYVLEAGQTCGLRHFLFGSTPAVLERLQGHLLRRFPSARIVGTVAPPIARDLPSDPTCLSEIRESQPHIVWCALGAPKQEVWMHEQAPSLAPAFVLGVGAAFDFLALTKPRAPQLMQDLGLEWLHRLLSEPRRLTGRYLSTNAEFIGRSLVYSVHRRTAQ
jgi:N-acetylglucosaminyldiphosphoundecaprenol N-acetyl-beta-D-mannosaminyltransferase